MKGNTKEAIYLNNYIQEIKAELYKIYHQMASMNEFITADAIKMRYTGKEDHRKTIRELIRVHNDEIKRNIGISVVKATWTKFNTLEKS